MKKAFMALSVALALLLAGATFAQQNSGRTSTGTTTAGEEKTPEHQTKKGIADIGAVPVTDAKFSREDQNLMIDLVKGNMILLEAGRVAVEKAGSDDVRQLAQVTVEEQTSLLAKLKEIAEAKIVTLPSVSDGETQILVAKLTDLAGAGFDRVYMPESSVAGYEKLDKILTAIELNASDASLKGLAKATHPLVKAHLKIAKEIIGGKASESKAASPE